MAGRSGSLRPVRRPRLPRRSALLRTAVVAALLALATLVLRTPPGCPTAGPGSPQPGSFAPSSPVSGSAGPASVPPGPPGAGSPGPASPGSGSPGPVPPPWDEPSRGSADGGEPVTGPDADAGQEDAPGAERDAVPPLPAGTVGVPVRLAEPAALAVLRPGLRVDLLVAPAGGRPGETSLLAGRALVLDVVGAGATDGSGAVYLALRPDQAQRVVGQPDGSRFAVVVRE